MYNMLNGRPRGITRNCRRPIAVSVSALNDMSHVLSHPIAPNERQLGARRSGCGADELECPQNRRSPTYCTYKYLRRPGGERAPRMYPTRRDVRVNMRKGCGASGDKYCVTFQYISRSGIATVVSTHACLTKLQYCTETRVTRRFRKTPFKSKKYLYVLLSNEDKIHWLLVCTLLFLFLLFVLE